MDQEKTKLVINEVTEKFLAEIKPELELHLKAILAVSIEKALTILIGGFVATTENKIDDAFYGMLKEEIEKSVKKAIEGIKI